MELLSVREYLRVSRDHQQTGRSPDQQHDDNVRAIEYQGWTLHPALPYRDTDRSASRYAKKPREDFKRLVGDLETGEFGADVLAIWESSRGSRRVGEWVDLVDLCKLRSVRIWVTTHGRLYDPSNARDRRSLLEDAVDAEYESDKTSERLRRSSRASAEKGLPHGRNLYGYRRVYDAQTRALVRVEPHPDQAPVVQNAARRILQGDSIYAVARDLNVNGIPPRRLKHAPPYKNPGWTPSAVKQMLRIPAYAGKSEYRGEIIGEAMWPALIDFDTWQQLQATMSPAARKKSRDHTAKHLLSHIARCGVCEAPMKCGTTTYSPQRYDSAGFPLPRVTYTSYVCAGPPGLPSAGGKKGFHVSITEQALDDIVVDLVLNRIEHPDFLISLGAHSDEAQSERATLLAELAAHQTYLEDVRQRAAAALRFDLIVDQEARVQPLVEKARERLGRLSEMDPFVQAFIRSGEIRLAWLKLTLADRRRVIRAVVLPLVQRRDKDSQGRRGPNCERVEAVWR